VLFVFNKIYDKAAIVEHSQALSYIQEISLLFGSDSWYLESANKDDSFPAAGSMQQQQQQKLLDIVERLLSYGTRNDDDVDDDDYGYGWSNDALITVPRQLSSRWSHLAAEEEKDARKRSWLRRNRTLKRGPGSCINSCLSGGMSFVRCKSMCHW